MAAFYAGLLRLWKKIARFCGIFSHPVQSHAAVFTAGALVYYFLNVLKRRQECRPMGQPQQLSQPLQPTHVADIRGSLSLQRAWYMIQKISELC